jgi:hypothetical protein
MQADLLVERVLSDNPRNNLAGDTKAYEDILEETQFVMYYIASDSTYSTKQMAMNVQSNFTATSPAGCHIELDSSFECLLVTATQWLILSMSNHIVIQTLSDHPGAPVSGFSRFAGIYGLKSSVFRNGLQCSSILSNSELSRIHQGNWWC